ncbi:MAG: tRNA dihydrouridine(20/20a) synthase DusA [Robiginitomaculum sp.]|nr:tRNA dihydrouridine(20/20a) synthase DusA [Robiginitomaculum sp.]
MTKNHNNNLSIAPMMDWSDRHYRSFMRLITKRTVLYTEMLTVTAVIHGDRERLLGFSPLEHRVVLQLGGSDPGQLAEAAIIGEQFGYDEINLNVGCPSDRVQSGRFGAVLMLEPQLVAECISAMQQAVSIPVTVKCRVGVDEQAVEETLPNFIGIVADAGCQTFIIHARKAWLKGLSPKQNREIPPLNYSLVKSIKQQFPELQIILNGGLLDLPQAISASETLDGAMIGRAAYHNPWIFSQADRLVFNDERTSVTRETVVQGLIEYAALEQGNGTRLHDITRHVLGLFAGEPGARKWRQILSVEGVKLGADWRVIAKAAKAVLPEKFVA